MIVIRYQLFHFSSHFARFILYITQTHIMSSSQCLIIHEHQVLQQCPYKYQFNVITPQHFRIQITLSNL